MSNTSIHGEQRWPQRVLKDQNDEVVEWANGRSLVKLFVEGFPKMNPDEVKAICINGQRLNLAPNDSPVMRCLEREWEELGK